MDIVNFFEEQGKIDVVEFFKKNYGYIIRIVSHESSEDDEQGFPFSISVKKLSTFINELFNDVIIYPDKSVHCNYCDYYDCKGPCTTISSLVIRILTKPHNY